jgi:hypothetical protein
LTEDSELLLSQPRPPKRPHRRWLAPSPRLTGFSNQSCRI